MVRGLALVFIFILAACDEGRRRVDPSPPLRPSTCTNEGSSRCGVASIQTCRDGVWRTESCASGRTCAPDPSTGQPTCTDEAAACAELHRCQVGVECASGGDCSSGACGAAGVCVTASCGNGRQDGAETGVDCGGDCPRCFGEPCTEARNCATNDCKQGRCSEPSCMDGQRNGRETAADCGGDCPPCAVGAACRAGTDCASGRCEMSVCAAPPPSCSDGMRSGDETDVDCGGPCPGCPITRVCVRDGDCISMFCNLGLCGRPTCSDQIRNQGEADVDCGGPCPVCADGRACRGPQDCASGRCDGTTCGSCQDGQRNGDEAGMDCGGPCGPCVDGATCGTPAECASGRCERGRCASCMDGRHSGSEADVDCGGPCPACYDGNMCQRTSDCAGGGCEGGHCCTLNRCGTCGSAPFEVCDGIDNDCDGETDELVDIGYGALCPLQAGVCSGARAQCRGAHGWVCDDAAYLQRSSSYEPMESSCDRRDNDCDGTVDMMPCGAELACSYGQCINGQCGNQWRPDGVECNNGPNPSPSQLDACVFGQCTPVRSTCACTGPYDGSQRWGTSCTLYSSVAAPLPVERCGCIMNNGRPNLAYRYMTASGPRSGLAECSYCTDTQTRFTCR